MKPVVTRRSLVSMMASLPAFALIGQNVRADADEAILSVRLNDAEAQFTDATLSDLPQVSFSTTTLWTQGQISFAGPTLQSVLEATGAMQDVAAIRLTALNDYSVTMETALIGPNAPIVANRIDGVPFSVRDKGPLWIMFPFDLDIRYRSESFYALSIWQLSHIESVEPARADGADRGDILPSGQVDRRARADGAFACLRRDPDRDGDQALP